MTSIVQTGTGLSWATYTDLRTVRPPTGTALLLVVSVLVFSISFGIAQRFVATRDASSNLAHLDAVGFL